MLVRLILKKLVIFVKAELQRRAIVKLVACVVNSVLFVA
jgi:hypothetical protein